MFMHGPGDPHVISQCEAALKGAGGDATVQEMAGLSLFGFAGRDQGLLQLVHQGSGVELGL